MRACGPCGHGGNPVSAGALQSAQWKPRRPSCPGFRACTPRGRDDSRGPCREVRPLLSQPSVTRAGEGPVSTGSCHQAPGLCRREAGSLHRLINLLRGSFSVWAPVPTMTGAVRPCQGTDTGVLMRNDSTAAGEVGTASAPFTDEETEASPT